MRHETKVKVLRQWVRNVERTNMQREQNRARFIELRAKGELTDEERYEMNTLLTEGIHPIRLPSLSDLSELNRRG